MRRIGLLVLSIALTTGCGNDVPVMKYPQLYGSLR